MALHCSKCSSSSITRHRQGTTAWGTPRIYLTCLECGAQWQPGQSGQLGNLGCLGGCVVVVAAGGLMLLCFGVCSSIINIPPPETNPSSETTTSSETKTSPTDPLSAAPDFDLSQLAGLSADEVDAILGPPESVKPITIVLEEMPGEFRDYPHEAGPLTVRMYRGVAASAFLSFKEDSKTVADILRRAGFSEDGLVINFQSPFDNGRMFVQKYRSLDDPRITELGVTRGAPGEWHLVNVKFSQDQAPMPSTESELEAPSATITAESVEDPATTQEDKTPPETSVRMWTDLTGEYRIEAEFAGMAFGNVKLRTPDGRIIKLPMEKLSQADQEWIQNRRY